MSVFYVYAVVSAALIPILDNFLPILHQKNSIWLVPVLMAAFFVGFILIQLVLTVIMVLTDNVNGKAGKGENFFRFLVKNTVPLLMFISGAKVEAKGAEKLPENTPVFFVCNHQHEVDPFVLFYCFPDARLSFVGKKDIIEKMPFVARLMHRLSCLFIDRENDREAAKTIVLAIKHLKDRKGSMALFPEGYTSKDGELQPFRNGSLKVALKSGAPVAVCTLDGTKKFAHELFKKRNTIKLQLVRVITSEEYENMNTAELGSLIHSDMEAALAEMRA